MRTSHHGWPRSSITRLLFVGCGLFCVIALISVFMVHYATSTGTHTSVKTKTLYPTINIDAGFDDVYRVGYWTPVRVTVTNPGEMFTGKLAVQSYSSSYQASNVDTVSPWQFMQAITLDKGQQRQFTIYAPHNTGSLITRGFQATLIDAHGKTVVTQASKPGAEIQPGYILIGVLSDNPLTQAQLLKMTLPGQTDSTMVSKLTATTMPSSEAVLENFDALVLDDFSTQTLSTQQMTALRIWVNRGGALVIVGGSNWVKTLGPLPADLRPINIHGFDVLPAHTHLLTFNGNSLTNTIDGSPKLTTPTDVDKLTTSPIINTASIQRSAAFSSVTTLLATNGNTIPLIVQAQQGSGTIDYLALDPASAPLSKWTSAPLFWQAVLESAMGNALLISTSAQSYDAGPGEILARGGLINFLTPSMPQGTLAIILLLIGYLLLLGPLRALLLHKRHYWRRYNGQIVVCILVISSLLAYSLATYERNSAVTDNSISITQIGQDGTTAHTTTYMGVLAPRAGDVNLQIPGNNLAEPIAQPYLDSNSAIPQQSHKDTPTTVTSAPDETNLTIRNPDLWTMNPVITEQDQHLQGQITSNLSLRNDRVVGTVTNKLPTSLNDVYILFPHNFISLGHLAPKETKKIDTQLKNTTTAPELSLADQIEKAANLPAQYFPYKNKQQPPDDFDLHMAMLSALSGVGYSYTPCGGPCQTHAITNKGIIYVTGGQIPDPNYKNSTDPLLLDGTQATLIGWASQRITDTKTATTVNNVDPQGLHLNFIQMPLNLTYTGVLDLPHDFVTGEVVNINSFDASEVLPGAYSLSSGSVTFSLNMPATPHAYISNVTISVPDLISNPNGQGDGSPVHSSSMQERIFNWQTNKWENMQLDQHSAFTTDNLDSYAGPNNRILVQVTSHNNTQIYFGKPELNINGNAS